MLDRCAYSELVPSECRMVTYVPAHPLASPLPDVVTTPARGARTWVPQPAE